MSACCFEPPVLAAIVALRWQGRAAAVVIHDFTCWLYLCCQRFTTYLQSSASSPWLVTASRRYRYCRHVTAVFELDFDVHTWIRFRMSVASRSQLEIMRQASPPPLCPTRNHILCLHRSIPSWRNMSFGVQPQPLGCNFSTQLRSEES